MERVNLPERFVKVIEEFIDRLKAVYGEEELISVILYGSAARGDFSGANSNINLAVVLADAGLANLKRIAAIANAKAFNPLNIIYLTESYIRNSADVFPVEFLDMKENNAVLFGKDILKGLEIDQRNLRFQCEQELKSKLVNLKRLYIKNAKNGRALSGLLFRYSTSCLHIFNNLIRLKGARISGAYSRKDILEAMGREFGMDAGVFTKIMEAKDRGSRLKPDEAEGLLFGFAAELEKVVSLVDRL